MFQRAKETPDTKVIKAYFAPHMTDRIWSCIAFAKADLWQGPICADDKETLGFPADLNFERATDELRAWWAEHGSEIWIDGECVLTSEPEPWTDDDTGETFEPCWDEITHYRAQGVKEVLFSRELAEYV